MTRATSPDHVRWALVRHVAGIAVVMVGVGVAVLWQGDRVASEEAGRAAANDVRASALSLVVPLTAADMSGSQLRAFAILEEIAVPRTESGELDRVHLWAQRPGGTAEIVWSSDPAAVGAVEDESRPVGVFGTTDVPVNAVGTRDYPGRTLTAPLYEAYAGFTDRSGLPYVLEVYQPVRQYGAIRSALLADWLPLAVGGVVLLGLLTLPLSVILSLGMVRADRERRAISRDALTAASDEHRRIAEVLHEQTVQDLAAVTLLLGALRDEDLGPQGRDLVDRVEAILATDLRHLRELLQDGSAADEYDDLLSATRAWVEHLDIGSTSTVITIAADLRLADPAVDLAHRVMKELLRNVAKHAESRRVEVTVTRDDEELVLDVLDDGVGFEPEGHHTGSGLRLVRAAVRAWGGQLRIESGHGAGTHIAVRLPERHHAHETTRRLTRR